MPQCPKCRRPMATVLKREGGVVRTYYECPYCHAEDTREQHQQPCPNQGSGSTTDGNSEIQRSHPVEEAKA